MVADTPDQWHTTRAPVKPDARESWMPIVCANLARAMASSIYERPVSRFLSGLRCREFSLSDLA